MELMSTNAKGSFVREQNLLLVGACVLKEHPHIVEDFKGYTILSFCPEKEHINMAFYKLVAMMSVAASLTVITVDGSPHCVQMHYIVDEVLRYSEKKFPVKHYVVYRGKLLEISPEAVKTSRYLRKVDSLLH